MDGPLTVRPAPPPWSRLLVAPLLLLLAAPPATADAPAVVVAEAPSASTTPTARYLPERDVQRAAPRASLPVRFLTWTGRGDGMLAIRDGRVAVTDLRGVVRQELRCPGLDEGEGVREGALSPDGEFAAALLADGKMCIWNVSGSPRLLPWRGRRVRHVALGNDVYALGYDDGRVEVRELATGVRRWQRNYRLGAITDMTFDREGDRLGISAARRGAAVIDPRSGRLIRAFGRTPAWSVAFDDEGGRVAAGLDDGKVALVDARRWLPLGELAVRGGRVVNVDFAEDGALLAIQAESDAPAEQAAWLSVWEFGVDGEVFREPLPAGPGPALFSFSRHGDQLVGDSGAGMIWLWTRPVTPWRPWAPALLNPPFHRRFYDDSPLLPLPELTVPQPVATAPGAAALSPDGQALIVPDPGGWALRRGDTVVPLAYTQGLAAAPAWSSDGKRLLARDAEGRILLWDGGTGAVEARVPGEPLRSLDSSRGRLLAVATDGRLLRAGGGQKALTAVEGVTGATAAAMDPVVTERVAVGTRDGTVAWLVPGKGNVRVSGAVGFRQVSLGTGEVVAMAFAPDGKRLAVAARRLGDAGAVLTILGEDEDVDQQRTSVVIDRAPLEVAWSTDGKQVLARSAQDVTVIDAEGGAVRLSLQAPTVGARLVGEGVRVLEPTGAVRDVALATGPVAWIPRGHRYASGTGGRRTAVVDGDIVELWQTEDGYRVGRLPAVGEEIGAVAFDADDDRIALRYASGDVETYDTTSAVVERRYSVPDDLAATAVDVRPWVRYSPDGSLVWAAVGPRTLLAWDVAEGIEAARVEIPGQGPLRPDARLLSERIVALYEEGAPGDPAAAAAWVDIGADAARRLYLPGDGRRPLAALADRNLVAFADGDSVTRANVKFGLPPGGPIRVEGVRPGLAAAFDPSGTFLAIAYDDGIIRVFDERGSLQATIGTVPPSRRGRVGGRIVGIVFDADGRELRTTDENGWVRRWDWRIGEEGPAFPQPPGSVAVVGSVTAVAVDDARRRLYTGHSDGLVRAWSLATGEQVGMFSDHGGPVRALAVSPDGTRVISGSDDDTVRILQAEDLAERTVVPTYGDVTTGVALAADGSRFAAIGASGVVRVWATENREQLARWSTGGVRGATLGFDDSRVTLLGTNGGLTLDPDTRGATVGLPGTAPAPTLPAALATTAAGLAPIARALPIDGGARWLVIGEDGRLRYWEAASGALLATVTALTDGAWVIDRADGRRLSSPSLRDETAPPARLAGDAADYQ